MDDVKMILFRECKQAHDYYLQFAAIDGKAGKVLAEDHRNRYYALYDVIVLAHLESAYRDFCKSNQ